MGARTRKSRDKRPARPSAASARRGGGKPQRKERGARPVAKAGAAEGRAEGASGTGVNRIADYAERQAAGKKLAYHPLSNLLPMMTPAERSALRMDLATSGQRDPIILLDGKILDGRNRYEELLALGKEPRTQEFDPAWGDPLDYVYSKAVHRNLTDSQKACAAVQIEAELAKGAQDRRLSNLKQMQGRPWPIGTRLRIKSGPLAKSIIIVRNYDGPKVMIQAAKAENDRHCIHVLIETLKQNVEPEREPVHGHADCKSGRSDDAAGQLFGVSGRYVSAAKELLAKSPELFDQVFKGELPITRAKRAYLRGVKTEHLKKRAKIAAKTGGKQWEVIFGDAIEELRKVPGGNVRLIFTDPPYNLGIDYGNGAKADKLDDAAYLTWCGEWIAECYRVLAGGGAMYLLNASRWCGAMQTLLDQSFGRKCWRATIAWVDTFGNYTTGNFADCWRPILYYTKEGGDRIWHGEQILIPSDRQAKYGDARACPEGKVPSNVWTEFPRLVDNDPERIPGFPTQIPQALAERIILVASEPGDLVADPFNGSGTTGAAALRHGRRYLGIDNVEANVKAARLRLASVVPATGGK